MTATTTTSQISFVWYRFNWVQRPKWKVERCRILTYNPGNYTLACAMISDRVSVWPYALFSSASYVILASARDLLTQCRTSSGGIRSLATWSLKHLWVITSFGIHTCSNHLSYNLFSNVARPRELECSIQRQRKCSCTRWVGGILCYLLVGLLVSMLIRDISEGLW